MKTSSISRLLTLALLAVVAPVSAQPATQPANSPELLVPTTQSATTTQAVVVAPPPPVESGSSTPLVPEPSPGWQLSLSFPLWIPAIDGDLMVGGREISADQDTGDSIDFLDERLNGAFVLHFEAKKEKLAFFVDALYLDLEAEGTLQGVGNQAFLKGFIGELGAAYTIVEPKRKGFGAFQLDAIGGVRVSSLEIGVESQVLDASSTETVYDPFVGARLELGLTSWLSARARGDVGGFGIAAWQASDMVYNFDAGLEFHLAQWFDLGLGYRWLNYDFLNDSETVGLDATISGPYLELKFNF